MKYIENFLNSVISLDGRCGRKKFWTALAAFYFFTVLIVFAPEEVMKNWPAQLILFPVALIVILSLFTTTAKRLHDRNRSGWWMFLTRFFPIIGDIWLLIECGFKGPVNENNIYGEIEEYY